MPKASTSSAAQSEVKIYSKVVALCTAWNKSYNSKGVDQEFTDECKQSQEKMKERLSLKVGLNFEAHNAWPDTPKEMMSEVEAKLAGLTDRDLFIFSYDGHGGSSRTGTFLLKKDLDLSDGRIFSPSQSYVDLEKKFCEAACDVLVMVDCCEAAAAVTDWGKRSKGFQMPANKKMNLIAACAAGSTTIGHSTVTMNYRVSKQLQIGTTKAAQKERLRTFKSVKKVVDEANKKLKKEREAREAEKETLKEELEKAKKDGQKPERLDVLTYVEDLVYADYDTGDIVLTPLPVRPDDADSEVENDDGEVEVSDTEAVENGDVEEEEED